MSNTAGFSVEGMKNGTYTVDVEIGGGNGTDMICTPMNLFVDDGQATAVVVWTTTACEYMEMDGNRMAPMSRDDGSVFYLPVVTWDEELSLLCGLEHNGTKDVVEYTATFDSASLTRQTGTIIPLAIMFTLVGILAVANAYVMVKKHNRYADRVEKKRPKKWQDK